MTGSVYLNLGSGEEVLTDHLNVDVRVAQGVDLICDLEKPLPFPPRSVDHIRAKFLLEHLYDPFEFLAEAYRILTPGATLELKIPHANSPVFKEHPDHRSSFTYETLPYLTGQKKEASQYYSYKFELEEFQFYYTRTRARYLVSPLFKWFNRFPGFVKYISHFVALDVRMLIVLRKPDGRGDSNPVRSSDMG